MKEGQKVREKTKMGVSGILSIFLMCFDSSFVLIGRKSKNIPFVFHIACARDAKMHSLNAQTFQVSHEGAKATVHFS